MLFPPTPVAVSLRVLVEVFSSPAAWEHTVKRCQRFRLGIHACNARVLHWTMAPLPAHKYLTYLVASKGLARAFWNCPSIYSTNVKPAVPASGVQPTCTFSAVKFFKLGTLVRIALASPFSTKNMQNKWLVYPYEFAKVSLDFFDAAFLCAQPRCILPLCFAIPVEDWGPQEKGWEYWLKWGGKKKAILVQ